MKYQFAKSKNEVLQLILTLGGKRGVTFKMAAEHFLNGNKRNIVETGCFRGNADDGNSTLILAILASFVNGHLLSIDTNQKHIDKAYSYIADWNESLCGFVSFLCRDSVSALSLLTDKIDLLYLDSYDFSEDCPLPSQLHQLAEIGAAWGKLGSGSGLLLDDFQLKDQGKCRLCVDFLQTRRSKLCLSDYQLYYQL